MIMAIPGNRIITMTIVATHSISGILTMTIVAISSSRIITTIIMATPSKGIITMI